jgi:hypothetical protein
MSFLILLSALFSLPAQADLYKTTAIQLKLVRQNIHQSQQQLVAQSGKIPVRYNDTDCFVLAQIGDLPCQAEFSQEMGGLAFTLAIRSDVMHKIVDSELLWTQPQFMGEFETTWPKRNDLSAIFISHGTLAPDVVPLVSGFQLETADHTTSYQLQ